MNKKPAWQRVECPDEGQSICFDLIATLHLSNGEAMEIREQGFITCFQGQLRAWRNHCPHAGSPMDWVPGRFYTDDGKQLVCHTHGALFDPLSGDCLSGPCTRGLYPLEIKEDGGELFVPCCADSTP